MLFLTKARTNYNKKKNNNYKKKKKKNSKNYDKKKPDNYNKLNNKQSSSLLFSSWLCMSSGLSSSFFFLISCYKFTSSCFVVVVVALPCLFARFACLCSCSRASRRVFFSLSRSYLDFRVVAFKFDRSSVLVSTANYILSFLSYSLSLFIYILLIVLRV